MRPKWVTRTLALFAVCVVGLSVTPGRAAAQADLADLVFVNADSAHDVAYLAVCGRYWPTENIFETKVEGSVYTAKWRFRFANSEVGALKNCVKTISFPAANFLEADFRLLGFQGVDGWENYSMYSSNLPGATHDVALGDSGNKATPGASAIDVDALGANIWYDVQVSWDINGGMAPISGQTPRVSFELVPSHWAMTSDPTQSVCLPFYAATQNKAWCVFGHTRAFVSHGYRNTVSVPFSGYQSFSYPQLAPPPPRPLLHHGPVPDAMIVESTQGHLYVAAGGRLFWFDRNNTGMLNAFRGQMQQKYGNTAYPRMDAAEVHAVEVNRTSTGAYSPGSNMPADNTFMYQYGTTQQYVVKYQHPFAVGDSNEVIALGGQDRAIMVPPGLSDLQTYPPQWVQDDLLRFGTDPSVWHFVGQGYRVPGVPTRDCLTLRHNRGVTYMPASAWNYFPTHPTQQAACDFADGQWMFGTPSNRQIVMMYGAGYHVSSAEEVVALGGQNKAVPVADETINGLLARTGSLPNDELVKSHNSPPVYHVVGNKLHYVGSPATRDCLSARSGKQVRTVPGDLIGRMQANGQTGANAYCELENRQVLAPNNTGVAYIKNGYRQPVTNPAIRDCIAVRAGAGQPLPVTDNVWNSYTAGPNAYCPYETEVGLNFVQEAGDPTVWVVHGPAAPGQPGTKQHAGSLCVPDPYTTQLKKYHVWTVPAGETAGHVKGADFWASGATCAALPG